MGRDVCYFLCLQCHSPPSQFLENASSSFKTQRIFPSSGKPFLMRRWAYVPRDVDHVVPAQSSLLGDRCASS